ncbi:MAG: hypothetical protein JO235_18090 [Chroococcidiopsidaceae cyanobacterium CP_BM_RX_35]|nr:hypothetical protein [Chroococcidiopsidaceae cyanobacterium CP_BM_RX_35]
MLKETEVGIRPEGTRLIDHKNLGGENMKPDTHNQSVQEKFRYLMAADHKTLRRREQCLLMRGLQQIEKD